MTMIALKKCMIIIVDPSYPELEECGKGAERLEDVGIISTGPHDRRTKLSVADGANQRQDTAEYPHNDRHPHLRTETGRIIRRDRSTRHDSAFQLSITLLPGSVTTGDGKMLSKQLVNSPKTNCMLYIS